MEAYGGYLVDKEAVTLVENKFLDFLKRQQNELYYKEEVEVMISNESNTMFIDFEHVMKHNDVSQKAISDEYLRFEPYLQNACKRFVMDLKKTNKLYEDSPNKDINIAFHNIPMVKRLRELTTSEIGRLVSVTGVVTRTSEVRPELLHGTFKCLECGGMIKNVEQQFKYTEPKTCPSATCNNRTNWALLREESKFTDWQKVRMQETSKEIPAGSLPRSLDVILRHEIVEHARAGDTAIFTGTVVVIPDILALACPGQRAEYHREASQRKGSTSGNEGVRGLKALGVRDLSYHLAFIANSVQICDGRRETDIRNRNNDSDEDDHQFTEQELDEVERMRNTPNFFHKLVDSVAPTIFGHREIKRAILLMLVGGVHKLIHEGINLGGDINVCIVGDPSCAKSQFLKYTSSIVPRSVYTSGKSSSAAGLTATVAKEPETGEFCIEAGALMLADNGISCIDEFDKMDTKDQVAIHEAMEQQTISITKAGIQATLNARTSILAAANPSGGRYDKSKSLKYNVALPPAILSRFDLVYVMVDDPDETIDANIAQHIVKVHQKRNDAFDPAFTTAELKRYIAYAKTLNPTLTSAARNRLANSYVSLRRSDAYRMTVRQLEALIRLSEATARIYLESQVQLHHVHLAEQMLKTSIIRVESSEIDRSEFQEPNMEDDTESPADDGSYPQGKKITISYEKFQKITRALVVHLRQHEENVERLRQNEETEVQEGTGLSGMKQRDLIKWYVELQNEKNKYRSAEDAAQEVSEIKTIIEVYTYFYILKRIYNIIGNHVNYIKHFL
ncbi:putative DNA helicase [Medicago truncatula]|uniref:DNA replication licensing factor MCM6 n=1 Tax=Medicago truncatula TaxID=3880 RepID=A0A396J571_MEDTR|nr:putative DNA helicase [Medicago truncatula]